MQTTSAFQRSFPESLADRHLVSDGVAKYSALVQARGAAIIQAMTTSTARIRIGTRGSALARWQAEWVAHRLAQLGAQIELVPITTQGDVKSGPLARIGGEGLFTKELQRALLDQQTDIAVHSLKDLPTAPVDGLALAAVPERESVRDVMVSNVASRIEDLPPGAHVGTGSLRRKAQLLHLRPDLIVEDIRGNIETRLKKLDDGQFAAIILAEAGLKRLGLAGRIAHVIPPGTMLSAVGQGALGIEARENDVATRSLVSRLDHAQTHQAVLAERTLLHTLRAGCMAPVGAWGRVENEHLILGAVVLSPDGSQRLASQASGQPADAIKLGSSVADDLLKRGAAKLIAASRAG